MHRITYVSSIDFKASTRKFSTLDKAADAWNNGIANNPAWIAYAVWHEEGVGIVAEQHRRLYNTTPAAQ